MKHRTTCLSDGACLWHNGLSINISLLTELFMVFFQKTKLLPKNKSVAVVLIGINRKWQ